jgi:outer membrane protein assembly factor BamB
MRLSTVALPLTLSLLVAGCGGEPETFTVDPAAAGSLPEGTDADGWPRWGGPSGDFVVDGTDLADAWPPEGPPTLWSRPLGEGYSAIAAGGGMLFAMHRDEDTDVVSALRAADGATIWTHTYIAETREGNQTQFGSGPNATPLLLDDRVITLGYTGWLHCLDRETGDVQWAYELIRDFGGEVLDFGYSASPVLHDGKVIVLTGGNEQAVLALDPADGSVAWRSAAGSVSYATPIAIEIDGRRQIVYLSADEVLGIDGSNGELQWRFPVVNQYRNNATDPRFGDDGLLWVATQLDGGTRALRLSLEGDATRVEEAWSSTKMSIHYWNVLRLGDHVYASLGSNGSILAGIDVTRGEILWRERGFEKANFVHAGDRTVLLDAEGRLALLRLGPERVEILAQVKLLDGPTWTVPTLVGSTLFVRDQKAIRALDLGPAAAAPAPAD